MLWLGEEFAQLETEFCDWKRSATGTPARPKRSTGARSSHGSTVSSDRRRVRAASRLRQAGGDRRAASPRRERRQGQRDSRRRAPRRSATYHRGDDARPAAITWPRVAARQAAPPAAKRLALDQRLGDVVQAVRRGDAAARALAAQARRGRQDSTSRSSPSTRTDGDIAAFRKAHPEAPASSRVADARSTQAAWFAQLGLDWRAADPDPRVRQPGRSRSLRARRRVREQDLAVVEKLLSGR